MALSEASRLIPRTYGRARWLVWESHLGRGVRWQDTRQGETPNLPCSNPQHREQAVLRRRAAELRVSTALLFEENWGALRSSWRNLNGYLEWWRMGVNASFHNPKYQKVKTM